MLDCVQHISDRSQLNVSVGAFLFTTALLINFLLPFIMTTKRIVGKMNETTLMQLIKESIPTGEDLVLNLEGLIAPNDAFLSYLIHILNTRQSGIQIYGANDAVKEYITQKGLALCITYLETIDASQ